jgi:hypothetical protein
MEACFKGSVSPYVAKWTEKYHQNSSMADLRAEILIPDLPNTKHNVS